MLIGVLLLVSLTGCGGRWVPIGDVTVAFKSDRVAYQTTLTFLRGRGYRITQRDDQRMFIYCKAKLDGDTVRRGGWDAPRRNVERVSLITFEVSSNGQVLVKANGYHVREKDGVMHQDLKEEIDALVADLTRATPANVSAPQEKAPSEDTTRQQGPGSPGP